ncbi:MAG: TM2 domain-containing protein [Defluviitaleaceae bacterium]|nr:TM2 domain-containing protein [Defluviitaleaceae bacterium]
MGEEKRISKIVLLLMSIFVGSLGVDRFMRGQIGWGILKLVTCGGFFIWELVDLIIIATKWGQYEGDDFVFVDGEWKY